MNTLTQTSTHERLKALGRGALRMLNLFHMSHWVNFEALHEYAEDLTAEVLTRPDVPHDERIPEDLRDVKSRFFRTVNGYRVAGRIHVLHDLFRGPQTAAEPLMLALIPLFAFMTQFGSVGQVVGSLGLLFQTYVISSMLGGGRLTVALLLGAVIPLSLSSATGHFHLEDYFSVSKVTAAWAQGGLSSALTTVLAPLAALVLLLVLGVIGVTLFSETGHARSNMRIFAIYVLYILAAVVVAQILGRFIPGMTAFAPWAIAASMPTILTYKRWTAKATDLLNLDEEFTGESGGPTANMHTDARAQQAANAIRDTSPLVTLGIAKGMATTRMDGYAPDRNAKFRISLKDLSTHLFVFGRTGTGKTEGGLKTIARSLFVYANAPIGALIMDGKNDLAAEFQKLKMKRYTLITGDSQLGLIEGLTPTQVADAIFDCSDPSKRSAGGDNSFFYKSGYTMLASAAQILWACVELNSVYQDKMPTKARMIAQQSNFQWHMGGVIAMLTHLQNVGSAASKNILDLTSYHPDTDTALVGPTLLKNAISYFVEKVATYDEKTRSNIFATIAAVTDPLFLNEKLVKWSEVTTGVDITSVLRGERIGLMLPEQEYGPAGLLVASLVKQRLFSALRRRKTNWRDDKTATPCVFMFDECQALLAEGDKTIAPIARSLGCTLIYATQNIEGLEPRLGNPAGVRSFLDNFRSTIVMSSSWATIQWIQEIIGQAWVRQFGVPGHSIDYRGTGRLLAQSALVDPNHPNRAFHQHVLRDLMKKGMGGMGYGQLKRMSDPDALHLPSPIMGGQWKLQPLFDPAEIEAQLSIPFTALAQIMRGGVKRRDFITLTPDYKTVEVEQSKMIDEVMAESKADAEAWAAAQEARFAAMEPNEQAKARAAWEAMHTQSTTTQSH